MPLMKRSGVQGDDGSYRQLATTLLQIENEFYGTIRPKRRIRRGERPLHALTQRGVEYLEVRSLDVDPFSAIGIDAMTMHFLDVFLLHCLLADSPLDTPEEIAAVADNQYRVAERGREPGIRLTRGDGEVELVAWGAKILAECAAFAEPSTRQRGGHDHRNALATAAERLRDPHLTPSARILREVRETYANSYVGFALAQSSRHRAQMLALPLEEEAIDRMRSIAETSLAEEREIEESDAVPFEVFRQQYLGRDLLGGMSA